MGITSSLSRFAQVVLFRNAESSQNDSNKKIDISRIEANKVDEEKIYAMSYLSDQRRENEDFFLPSLPDLCVRIAIREKLPVIGLPSEIVDIYVSMLAHYHAIGRDTLQLLKDCDMSSVSFDGCRAVDDSWLHPMCEESNNLQHIFKFDLTNCRQLSSEGFCNMQPLRDLRDVSLRHCHSLGNDVLYQFAESNLLKTFSAAHMTKLNNDGVLFLSQIISLQVLDLEGCHNITDEALVHIKRLINLKKLNISQCHNITRNGITNLAALTSLEHLNLGWCRLLSTSNTSSQVALRVPKLQNLTYLCIATCAITDDSLPILSNHCPLLQDLSLSQCLLITNRGLMQLQLPHLKSIDLSRCFHVTCLPKHLSTQVRQLKMDYINFSLSAIRDISETMVSIEKLSLAGCHIDNQDIVEISRFSTLTSLSLKDTIVSQEGLLGLSKLTSLVTLDLSFCHVTNSNLSILASTLKNLIELYLDSRDITDSGISRISCLTGMIKLHLGCCSISDSSLIRTISKMTLLTSFEIYNGRITDNGVLALQSLSCLQHLDLSRNSHITNRSAPYIAQLTNLCSLNLSRTHITESAVPHLKELFHLKSLAMYECGMSIDAQMILAKALPALLNLKV